MSYLQIVEDVTDKVMAELTADMTEEQRSEKVKGVGGKFGAPLLARRTA
ncbi:MAG: hypothetical protein IPP83_00125 [Flavobacteriales bacterium]|nr:hypothetical protein [Flavobacteriales bacterium]